MAIKPTLYEAGTQIHIAFSPGSTDDTSLTMNMFTKDSIDIKIWRGKHKCIAQTFIDVNDLLNAIVLFNKLKINGVIKSLKS